MFLCCVVLIFWLFILAAFAQGSYALYFFVRVFRLPLAEVLPADQRMGVTIVICAKNESANLKKNLPLILAQEYRNREGRNNYEVIVVNDGSTDETVDVLRVMAESYPGALRVINKAAEGKKSALRAGVDQAANEWLVLIDADCEPASNNWLALMVEPLGRGIEIVAGYGGYYATAGLLNAFIRWETVHTFLQYSTYALAGLPYMAVGRNMACTRTILQQAQQNELWNVLPSGDDDLLVRIAGNAGNTATVCDAAAFTHTASRQNRQAWIKQKQRHLSTGKFYKNNIKMLLGGYGMAHALLWVAFVALLFGQYMGIALMVMGVRCVVYWGLWAATANKLKEKGLSFLFPLFDIGWLIYNFAFLPYITWKNKEQWK